MPYLLFLFHRMVQEYAEMTMTCVKIKQHGILNFKVPNLILRTNIIHLGLNHKIIVVTLMQGSFIGFHIFFFIDC